MEHLIGQNDSSGNIDKLAVAIAGSFLQSQIGSFLVNFGLAHDDSLGALDEFAMLDRFGGSV